MKITFIILCVWITIFAVTHSIRTERQRGQFMAYCHATMERGMEDNTILIFWKHHDNICSGEFDQYREGHFPEMIKKWQRR